LDAGNESRFRHINRPHGSISFARMVEGLLTFRKQYRGQYWLEVFLLAGYTSMEAEVRQIADWVRRISPDRVHLNTAVRPPAERYAEPVPRDHLDRLAGLFEPHAEVIADRIGLDSAAGTPPGEHDILEMLLRRPCSVQDVAGALQLRPNEVIMCLDEMCRRKVVEQVIDRQGVHYRAVRSAGVAHEGQDD
jgi:wyosine [tRNA(Phe)-imidazoG37] synthetase (radical SAM superfamily)